MNDNKKCVFLKVGEEGVGIDASETGEPDLPMEFLEGSIIADARPVGKLLNSLQTH